MSEPVLIAIIAAGATVIAAIIGVFAAKAKNGSKTIIRQKNKGKEKTIQVGIIKAYFDDKRDNTEGKKNERKC